MIQWTDHTLATLIQNMGIDHRRGNITMPQQFLRRADIVTRLQKMRSKGKAQRIRCSRFGQPRCQHGLHLVMRQHTTGKRARITLLSQSKS